MPVGNTSEFNGVDDLVDRVLVGRYRVTEVVSTGANTVICVATDMQSDVPVTFKIVQPRLASAEEFRREFRKRAEVATALGHPNIASVLDWGDLELGSVSTVYWVVEHLGGGSLRDLFDRGRLLEPSQALVVGLEACRALDAAHQRGIAHTELTPSKLVFGTDRRLRLVDFGLAELLGAEAWSEPATVATHVARYASPEQALGLAVDPKTDVYALALCLLEAVTGSVPFASDSTVSTLANRVGKLMPVSADLGSLASVIERAGRPEPEDRFTAAEFGRALVQSAERLPRPEPIPVIATTVFDPEEMRRPTDPTGGVDRPADDPAVPEAPDIDPAVEPVDELTAAGDVVESAPEPPALSVPAPPVAGSVPPPPVASTSDVTDVEPVPAESDAPAGGSDPESSVTESAGPDPIVITSAAEDADSTVAEPTPDGAGADEAVSDEAVPDSAVSAEAAGDEPKDRVDVPAFVEDTSPIPFDSTSEITPMVGAVTPPPEAERPIPQVAAPIATQQMPITPPPAPASELYDDERPRRRSGMVVVISVLVLAGIAAVAFAAFYLLRTKSYEVPELAGAQEAVARNEVAGNGWIVESEYERSDEQPDVGRVIRTFPLPGAVLEEGADFTLVVSEGPLFRVLPDVTGQTAEAATATLAALQLQSFVDAEVFDEVVVPGVVLSWRVLGAESSVAGDEVLPDTNIALTVSKGPAPRIVPNVVGLTLADAQAAAAGVQLVVVAGEDAFSETVPVGVIISQDVAADTEVERDSTFTVVQSKGPDLIALPDLTGLTYVTAQQVLTDAGFTIGSLLGSTDGTFESISISAEPVGELYRRGTSVDLIFL